ncbi:hypothetical protein D3C86_2141100 [compost metagenome]
MTSGCRNASRIVAGTWSIAMGASGGACSAGSEPFCQAFRVSVNRVVIPTIRMHREP